VVERADFARVAMKVAMNKALEIPANVGSCIVAVERVASHLDVRYNRARDAHEPPQRLQLRHDLSIVADLKSRGAHITSLEALGLPGSDQLLDEGRRLYARYCGDGRPGSSPLARSFQAGSADVMANRGIFFWGLHDRLLDIVEAYLGVPVGYDGINIFFTKADGRQSASRRWHRDAEDRRMVKIGVYLNDVDEDGGPFELLCRIPSEDRMIRGMYPSLTQEKLERQLGDFQEDRDVATCVGKAGTVVFADTASHYHRGRPATSRDRCAVFLNYFHRVPLRPFRCERSTISRAEIAELAKCLPPRQRDCLLWRDQLPAIARLIPPAPIWD
jgi:hypothetical protein